MVVSDFDLPAFGFGLKSYLWFKDAKWLSTSNEVFGQEPTGRLALYTAIANLRAYPQLQP
jgi:hypothetical protein